MFLSIIIANFNKEKYLPDLLTELTKQLDQTKHEILLVDDASTDSSVEIARKYPVQIIRLEKNSGPAKARNIGSRLAKGNYFLFCDSDIKILPGTIKKLEEIIHFTKADLITGNLDLFPLNDSLAGKFLLLEEFLIMNDQAELTETSYWSTTFGAIKSNVFIKSGGFNEIFTSADIEDLELGIRLHKNFKMVFAKNLIFKHAFGSLWQVLNKRRRRVAQFLWLNLEVPENFILISKKDRMEIGLFFLLFFGLFFPWIFLITFSSIFVIKYPFLKIAYKVHGLKFLIFSICFYFILQIFTLAGAFEGFYKRAFLKLRHSNSGYSIGS